jgi:uncharacterized damage-inducible protein DinB
MANEIDRIVDQMNRAFRGEAWHGPSLMESLDGVTVATAAARNIANAHTIWELVLHVAVWKRTVERRLNGEAVEPTGAEDFPPMPQPTVDAWVAAVGELRSAHESMVRTFQVLGADRLHAIVPGKRYNVEFMMLGTAQHDCYHAGQMALLKKS